MGGIDQDPTARVSTGNPHLDSILNGGFVARRPYLIVGPVGTGKTKLALQFLCEGVRQGEHVLLVTLQDPPNELKRDHRALFPALSNVHVFDAIPDVLRYEVTPFTDVAEARRSEAFVEVADAIRRTPELTSVQITINGLQQTLKNELSRWNYSRLVIDSLTALEYFCLKGLDEGPAAQAFVRMLADIGATTVLTVEAPVEQIELGDRLFARGAIRLFRSDREGRTVRAIGVEKFRGSAHDVRLHPYEVSASGLEIDLATTISRDTEFSDPWSPAGRPPASGSPISLTASVELVRAVSDLNYLAEIGGDPAPAQAELDLAQIAAREEQPRVALEHLTRAHALIAEGVAAHRAPIVGPAAPAAWHSNAVVDSSPRLSTGVLRVDRMLGGGLLPGRPYLVTGTPGVGKTIFGLTFLAEGLRRGEEVLLVAVDEPPNEILENIRSVGWDFSKVHVLDANPGTRVTHRLGDVHSGRVLSDLQTMGEIATEGRRAVEGGEVSLQAINTKLRREMAARPYRRILIDSITSVRHLSGNSPAELQARRAEVQSLLRLLSEQGATTMVTATAGDPLVLTPEEMLARGEILLTRKWVGDRWIRFLKVQRMRGSAHSLEWHPFAMTSKGIFCE